MNIGPLGGHGGANIASPDAKSMFDKLCEYEQCTPYNGSVLYHFTDEHNIDSIRKYGILSYRRIQELQSKKEIGKIYYGGNEWSRNADVFSGMDNYVHLSFTKECPMAYYLEKDKIKLAWLEIDASILNDISGILYTNGVSNKSGIVPMSEKNALNCLDFDAIYKFLPFKEKGNKERKDAARKYEILIPNEVPAGYIRNI